MPASEPESDVLRASQAERPRARPVRARSGAAAAASMGASLPVEGVMQGVAGSEADSSSAMDIADLDDGVASPVPVPGTFVLSGHKRPAEEESDSVDLSDLAAAAPPAKRSQVAMQFDSEDDE
eukprot:gnl/Ergobibamus_cyprinoides/4117.p2 GENE.gnl/Ergobibamus_cyprinoides/4117~~gnl/Ergobibamus_cyprinoides/4117.p2  ORF type:complete len:123 (+),score=16.13 gnl/Ergobibamus_cyprinoides/4117:158-526(+)